MYFVIYLIFFLENIPVITVSDLKDIILYPENTPDRIKKNGVTKKEN